MIAMALAVATGGFLGGLLRWCLTTIAPSRMAIATANIVASFLLGYLATHLAADTARWALLATGLCGALSTWSTFANQVAQSLDDRRFLTAAGYGVGTVAGCVLAAYGAHLL